MLKPHFPFSTHQVLIYALCRGYLPLWLYVFLYSPFTQHPTTTPSQLQFISPESHPKQWGFSESCLPGSIGAVLYVGFSDPKKPNLGLVSKGSSACKNRFPHTDPICWIRTIAYNPWIFLYQISLSALGCYFILLRFCLTCLITCAAQQADRTIHLKEIENLGLISNRHWNATFTVLRLCYTNSVCVCVFHLQADSIHIQSASHILEPLWSLSDHQRNPPPSRVAAVWVCLPRMEPCRCYPNASINLIFLRRALLLPSA